MTKKVATQADLDTLKALGVDPTPKQQPAHSAMEERIIAGFEDIQRFVEQQGRLPQDREGQDVFERAYAVRLGQISQRQDCRQVVQGLDTQGLLDAAPGPSGKPPEEWDDQALLAELGVAPAASDLQTLKHVRPFAEKKAAEDIAQRQPCSDFATFKPLFDQLRDDLASGRRTTRRFEIKAEIEQGRFFIVKGQIAYVAEKGATILNDQGRTDARLRVIYDNGTQSNLLLRSLQRALNDDTAGRRITDPVAGPLFAGCADKQEHLCGTIYVLRSKSDDPYIAQNRDLIHKIGVTTNPVAQRIAGANLQPTFLLAGVEVVATYDLYDINPTKLEALIHRIFAKARLDIAIKDRLGRPLVPREWFLVPFFAIEQAVQLIRSGNIAGKVYDPEKTAIL